MAISTDDWRPGDIQEGAAISLDQCRSYQDVDLTRKMGIRMWSEKLGKWFVMDIPSLPER